VQPHRHAARGQILRHALQRKEAASAHNCRIDPAVFIPASESSVSIENSAEIEVARSGFQ
jgi:hypothetical protein